MSETMEEPQRLMERFAAARARRTPWEQVWKDCYDFVLPQGGPGRSGAGGGAGGGPAGSGAGDRSGERIFDGTAADAVDQLSASLLSQLTPPWSRWFGLAPGPDLDERERATLGPLLEQATRTVQAHFDRSNFAVEVHQCYLDLVTAGTACLLFEEAAPGEPSCFRFTAVPIFEVAFEEGVEGRLDATFRRSEMTLAQIRRRFPGIDLPGEVTAVGERDAQSRFGIVEAVLPDGPAWRYSVVLDWGGAPAILAGGRFSRTPFLNFRWLKAPGEIYGRSPVMKTLPDIRTANKVVELVLKNASIAVTGIWQADDDGVLNPASVRLVPGTVIPKAAGSSGLTPLAAPGRFDVSQLVLDDLRARIRHALLADRLAPVQDARMTATEVIERSAEMARLLGATYGRLQSELLTPLVLRGTAILRRRGEIPDIAVDGRIVELQYRAPLAQAQAQRDVQAVMRWLETVGALGADALDAVDQPAAARWLGRSFGVPTELIREPPPSGPPPGPPSGEPPSGEPVAPADPVPDPVPNLQGASS